MKPGLRTALSFVAGMLATALIIAIVSFDHEKPVNKPDYQWHAPSIPDALSFAGEKVPLEKWDVKERLDRELLFNYYWQNNILYLMKMSNRFFPIIEERLRANGIPEDFKYLCVAESNLLANATSRSGAVGFWQFLSGTAPGYNLEVNDQVDFRREIIRSTDAASAYLKQAYAKFGTWTAAAASYNCGQAGYQSHATFQKTKNYYALLLPEETNRYIFRILAFKHIMENASGLGFKLEDEELYHPIKTRPVKVTSSISNLAQFAIDNGTDYKTLKLLNPWLKSKSLRVSAGKTYTILLPAG